MKLNPGQAYEMPKEIVDQIENATVQEIIKLTETIQDLCINIQQNNKDLFPDHWTDEQIELGLASIYQETFSQIAIGQFGQLFLPDMFKHHGPKSSIDRARALVESLFRNRIVEIATEIIPAYPPPKFDCRCAGCIESAKLAWEALDKNMRASFTEREISVLSDDEREMYGNGLN